MADLADICIMRKAIVVAAGAVGSYTFPARTLTAEFIANGDLYWRLEDPPTDPAAPEEYWVPARVIKRWRDRNLPGRVLYFANKYISTEVTLWVMVEKSIDA